MRDWPLVLTYCALWLFAVAGVWLMVELETTPRATEPECWADLVRAQEELLRCQCRPPTPMAEPE